MAVEIEAKMQVEDLNAVRERIEVCGGTRSDEVMEINTFFDTEDRSLLAADQGLHLRHTRDIHSGVERFVLTFKGPRQHGQLKTREENEVDVAGHDPMVTLLQCLGFGRVMSFEKKRQSWKLQDCQIELDEVPYLGKFVEIEGPSEASVLKVREMLHLSDRGIVKASYVGLLMAYLQERGIAKRMVTFESEGKK